MSHTPKKPEDQFPHQRPGTDTTRTPRADQPARSTPTQDPASAKLSTATVAGIEDALTPEEEGKLPVLRYKQRILTAVKNSPATIITAETGAGKSTQVPQFLAEAGYKVIVTQPRRLAARTVSARVAQEMGTKLGSKVGFRTAEEKCDSTQTEILFCTDGLQMVRELTGQKASGGKTVLVLDEVHEWNTNMEVLIAWARKRIAAGEDLKVVIMSATLDAERLSKFFGESAPAIDVPGRLYPVEKRSAPSQKLVAEAAELAKKGRNVLVFQPGKKEIEETVERLEKELGGTAIVLPLHGQLTPEEQQKCFQSPPKGKTKVVVSTNVAQTSITIPDIDAVVDSGLERRVELADGIEGLYLKPISHADCQQRAGRAGRCKPGVYVLCSDIDSSQRQDFPKAEILRSRLDQTVLRLASQGFDMDALEFFHQPDKTVIHEAKRALIALGAMTEQGEVTKIGRRISKMPVAVQYGRMLLEAEKHGVVDQIATIAACLEAGDIRAKSGEWRKFTKETKSDLLALLDVYEAGKNIKGGQGKSKGDALREAGIFAKDYFRATEIRGKLVDAVRAEVRAQPKKFASREEERQAILRSTVAGMVDHLYQNQYGRYRNGGSEDRELARESVCFGQSPEWMTGLPMDLQIKDRRGRLVTLRLVTMASAVDPKLLEEAAPQLVKQNTGLSPVYSAEKDSVMSTTEVLFNGRKVREEKVADPEHPAAAEVFARCIAESRSCTATPLAKIIETNLQTWNLARELNARNGAAIFEEFSGQKILDFYTRELNGARNMAEISDPQRLIFPPLDQELVDLVRSENPDEIELYGEKFKVEYSADCEPTISLGHEWMEQNRWRELPDKSITLPGGKTVAVSLYLDYSSNFRETDIAKLKEKIRFILNQKQWENWTNKPTISIPDLSAEHVTIPEIITAQYGTCCIEGTPLIAYGTVTPAGYKYYSSDPDFQSKWFRIMDEAVKARTESLGKVEEIIKNQAEQKALRRLSDEASTLKEKAYYIYNTNRFHDDFSAEDLNTLYETAYDYPPGETEKLKTWIETTRALVEKCEQSVAESKERKKIEEERQRIAEEAQAALDSGSLEKYGVCGQMLQIARDFADHAVAVCHSTKTALSIIKKEFDAPYGRARRQDALNKILGGENIHENVTRVLTFGRATDLDNILNASIKILEEKIMEAVVKASEQQRQQKGQQTDSSEQTVAKTESAPGAEATPPVSVQKATLGKLDLSQLFGGRANVRK